LFLPFRRYAVNALLRAQDRVALLGELPALRQYMAAVFGMGLFKETRPEEAALLASLSK